MLPLTPCPVLAAPPLSACLAALAGAAAVHYLARARERLVREPRPPPRQTGRRRWFRRPRLELMPAGDPALPGRAARLPQAVIVSPLAAAAIAIAWLVHPALGEVVPRGMFILAGGAFALAFPLLIAERTLAAAGTTFPEAAALRALLVLALVSLAGAGSLAVLAGLGGAIVVEPLSRVLAFLPAAVAVEMTSRALARLFLPPPHGADARAAAASTIALILADGLSAGGLAAPVRRHLGLDFARGFALRFMRAALPGIGTCVALASWGVSGIVLVPPDQRAIYERFGAPVRVLPPGAHAILPWPLGRARPVEFGVTHAMTLGEAAEALPPFGAEETPPPAADQMWEQTHPAELTFLIASGTSLATSGPDERPQNFQAVSADIRAVWRVGLTDADAMRAHYTVVEPAAILRAIAGRAAAAWFAGETLDALLGETREDQANRLRAAIQRELDQAGTGIELIGMVIEAIHPPAGAADAYHAVQAAEILARTQIAAEQGNAQANLARASQYAADIIGNAKARAGETVAEARAWATRFSADIISGQAAGPSFLLNRYLSNVGTALSAAPLTIVDHRIPAARMPMLDLRPPTPPPASAPSVE